MIRNYPSEHYRKNPGGRAVVPTGCSRKEGCVMYVDERISYLVS